MKRFTMATLLIGALAMAFSARPATAQVNVSVSIGGFYDELAPYGQWNDCNYGRCWTPHHVGAGWQPYTNGQWVYTEYGWTWMSDDPWGGNPYHYGTWVFLGRWGWSWVPGTVWAPAWVTWSYSNNYVGWAPLPPTLVFGMSGYTGRPIVLSSTRYVFVPTNHFVGTNITSVRVAAQQNATIFRQTKPVTRFAVSGGIIHNTAIPVETIQRAGGARIETRSIGDAKATPRPMAEGTGGKGRKVAIVAPAREVKAAATAKSREGARSAAPSGQKGSKPESQPESGKAKKESRQETAAPRGTVRPEPQQQKAPKAHETPGKSHGQSAQPQAKAPKATGRVEAPPPPSRQAAPPAERHEQPPARVEARPGTGHAPAQSAKPSQPKQGSKEKKPAKKDKEEKDGTPH